MRKKCICFFTLIVMILEMLCPSFVVWAEEIASIGNLTTSDENTEVSIYKEWKGTDNPENYRTTFELYEEKEVSNIIEINCVEDLVDFALGKFGEYSTIKIENNDNDNDENSEEEISVIYKDNAIVLTKDLDFLDTSCYKDSTRKDYGDLNKDGITETLIEELKESETGEGFPSIQNFAGKFYGQGHEIKNIYSAKKTDYNGSIFESAINAMISDLTVTGTVLLNNKHTGGIVGNMQNSEILNCNGNVNLKYNKKYTEENGKYAVNIIGGLVGEAISSRIINCSNIANFSLIENEQEISINSIGGIVGYASEGCIIGNCSNSGNIEVESYVCYCIGGIVGRCISEKILGEMIYSCHNTGVIQFSSAFPEEEITKPCSYIGGIVAQMDHYGTNYTPSIVDCYNNGDIKCNRRLYYGHWRNSRIF